MKQSNQPEQQGEKCPRDNEPCQRNCEVICLNAHEDGKKGYKFENTNPISGDPPTASEPAEGGCLHDERLNDLCSLCSNPVQVEMKGAPAKVFLQIPDDCPPDAGFHDLYEVTWADSPINDRDLCYVPLSALASTEAKLREVTRLLEEQVKENYKFVHVTTNKERLATAWQQFRESKIDNV